MNIEELAREIAEYIIFTHATDIESLSVSEMTDSHVNWGDDDNLKAAFADENRFEELVDEVHVQIRKARVGVSWDGGNTWVM